MEKKSKKSPEENAEKTEIDVNQIYDVLRTAKLRPMTLTEIFLDEITIKELQLLAESHGVTYQALIGAFIYDGLERFKKAI